MRPKLLLALSLLLLPGSALAQSVRFQSQAISTRGAGIANATVAVCGQPANTNTQPCSPLATLATSTSTTSGGANPLTADSFGNFFFYAAPGRYTVQIYGPAVSGQFVIADVELGFSANGGNLNISKLNGKILVDNNIFPCTGAGLNSAIAALPAGGGTVDATACVSPNTIGVTVTSASVNNVIVLLGPYVWTTTVYPAFKIQSVSGNKIIGYYGDTPNASSPSSSVGTIIRSTGTLTGTSDLIDVIGSTSTEVGGMVLDFNQATPASGQYGVYSSSLLHENIHDIEVYNAGVDCFRWDTANGGPTYDTVAKNLRCQTANTEGFMLLSQSASGNDLARWHCINCSFLGTPQGSVTHFGQFGFHLQIPTVNGQILGDIICEACFANQTVSGVNNAAVFFDQAGTVKMYDIRFSGGFEDTSAANTGSAIRAATGTACGIDGVFVHYGQANFATSDNLIGNTGVCTVIDQFQAASGSGTRTLSVDKIVSGAVNASAAQGDIAAGRNTNTGFIFLGTDGTLSLSRQGTQWLVNGALLRAPTFAADNGTVCTNGELALSAGWGATATTTAVAGNGQTCQWTITSNGAGQAANPTITDTLTNSFLVAPVCDMRAVGGTGTTTPLFNQTTVSTTAPVFTSGAQGGASFTPVAGSTYIVVRRCGP